MYKLVSTRTEDVSFRRAQEILNKYNAFEGQRPMSQPWAQYLGSAMESGVFTKANIAFATNGNGVKYLMNGQHCCEGSTQFKTTFRATIDEYHCDHKDDFWKLFATFDVGKPRTERNVMKAAAGLFHSKELREVDLRALATCGTALSWLDAGVVPDFTMKFLDKSAKPVLVQKFEKDVLFYKSILDTAGCGQTVVCVCASIIATARLNQAKAKEFWPRVLGGYDLDRGSAEWRLSKDISAGLIVKTGQSGGSRLVKMWNLCASWWNAYARKESRKSVKLESIKGIVELAK